MGKQYCCCKNDICDLGYDCRKGDLIPNIGKKHSEAKQIARLGNAVCPPVATALIRVNCADMSYRKPLKTVRELETARCGQEKKN